MPAFVQAKSIGEASVSATSKAVTMDAAVGSGNLLAGIVTWATSTPSDLTSVTDDKGNSYTIVNAIADTGNNQSAASFYGKNLSGGPTVITANFGVSNNFKGLSVQEFSGLDTSAPLDGTNEQGQLQTSPGTGTDGVKSGASTQTPSVDNAVVFAGSVNTGATGTGSQAFTPGTNFTEPSGAEWFTSGDVSLDSEYWLQGTATAVNGSFTKAVDNSHITFQMVFKPSGGAADTYLISRRRQTFFRAAQ